MLSNNMSNAQSIPYLQVDKGLTKEETEDPKTIDKFTDRYISTTSNASWYVMPIIIIIVCIWMP